MNIIVAVDLSPASAKVIEAANGVAKLTGVSVYVLHVIETEPDYVAFAASPEMQRSKIHADFPRESGALQKLVKPIPLGDFNAEMKGDALQATAWIRTGGLRLAPVMMTWDDVDNPEGAKAFVDELDSRKQSIDKDESLLAPLDYWASWVAIGFVALLFPILFIRKWKQRSA